MYKSILQFSSLVFFLCFVVGCGSSAKFQNIPDGSALQILTPQRNTLQRESIPAEVKLVCSAIINKIRHRGETPHVRFFSAGSAGILDDDFDYEGFDLIRIDFTAMDLLQTEQDQTEGFVEGVFHFGDFVGRKASLYFMAEYMASPYGISISRSAAVQLPPHFPKVEAFFVPYKTFRKTQNKFQSYRELYAFALSNGLNMEPTEAERASFAAYQQLSHWDKKDVVQKKEKMIVMVFCKDRLKDVARFEVAASRGNIKPAYLNKNGWPIALYSAEFAPDSWGNSFDVMAFYIPENNAARYTVGKFTNQKAYDIRRQ